MSTMKIMNRFKYPEAKPGDTRPPEMVDWYILHEGWKVYGLVKETRDRESRIYNKAYLIRKFKKRLIADRFYPIEYLSRVWPRMYNRNVK